MSCPKRPLDGQDPDYEDNIPHETKRLRILEENAKAEFSERVSGIIQREFGAELGRREKEVLEIQERLQQAHKTLHLLRYVAVSSFYSKKQLAAEDKQKPIHPAVKKLIGKEPRSWEPLHQRPSKYRPVTGTAPAPQQNVSKVPRYIPPKSTPQTGAPAPVTPRRGMRHKIKKRIVIGNISKWVPVDTREDAASHKWMMYVRGPKEAPNVSGFISKVRFFLHPSYRPHDIAEVSSHPFHLSRRGWGEFPVRVQIHFTNPHNKPVDLIHHLKLDKTYTGLQTLGAETVVDIWLHAGEEEPLRVETSDEPVTVKAEGESPVVEEKVEVPASASVVPTPDHDYIANPAPVAATRLTTLVKCMDKNGHVIYLTLGKPQALEQTSLLRRKTTNSENGNSQRFLIMKSGQLYLVRHPVRSVLKKPERALVLNKQNSRQVNLSSRVRYEDALSQAVAACKLPDLALSVRWLLRHMPLTHPSAKDPDYRVVHPYAAPDDSTFLQWNIGKQRAAEWMRAKAVHMALRSHFPEQSVWSLRAIVVWARMHGYCPQPAREVCAPEPRCSSSSYSEPVRIIDWLETAQTSDAVSESEDEIDVEAVKPAHVKVRLRQEAPLSADVEVLNLGEGQASLSSFVRDTVQDIGYKLEPQELAPGVIACAAERMLTEAVRLLTDDLLRRALCQAWIRNCNKPPDCVHVEDVRTAILQRPELDMLSNRGLGVQVTDPS